MEDLPEGLDPTLAAILSTKKCVQSCLVLDQPLQEFPRD
jgi:hypothetical protein